ncbi:MAG TPA: LLM class flavin-dependent oxidoreductase [Thermomicrobiales bacterium]|nr:LLM class flavin-dependent oxidoreductase [Thermomicrobiales bacterium]
MARRLGFGICTDQNLDWPTTVERWRYFESLGFDSIWNCDHFEQPSRPGGPYHEAWTQLAGLAASTERIRIGVLVTSNTFRHPGLLVKEAITVDHISNGRLEFGIGAGWYVPEHEAYGLEFLPPGQRVEQFREAVEVMDRLFRDEEVSYEGRYYQLKNAPSRPRPIQQPRPPFTIGAHRPKMMRIVAEWADRWNTSGKVEEVRVKNQLLDEALAEVGRDPDSIIRSLYGWAAVMPYDPWESVDAFEHCIGEYREAGLNEFIIDQPDPSRFDVVEKVASDIIPRLRAES